MRNGLCGCAVLMGWWLLSASAAAEPAPRVETSAPPASAEAARRGQRAPLSTSATKPGEAATAVGRRDLKGIKGISPFMESLKRGDSALIARDFDGAIRAYREAIAVEPQNALGQYRVGEAQLQKGDLHEAEQAFQSGLRLVDPTNAGLKAKLQFALAELSERQKAWDEASTKWTAYETFTASQKLDFAATATERKKVIEAWKKLSADSAEVKVRIEKGIQSADAAVRKSSK